MEKRVFLVLMIVFLISFALADDWDSLVEDTQEEASFQQAEPVTEVYTPYTEETSAYSPSPTSSKGETKFTQDFYIALILIIIVLLIIAYFAYSFFKKPKNKWEK